MNAHVNYVDRVRAVFFVVVPPPMSKHSLVQAPKGLKLWLNCGGAPGAGL